MSFPFEVNRESNLPIWVQLAQRIVYLIDSGYYRPGDQLPSVRALAADISINYNTVSKAYTSLVSEGYLESVRRKGCFVAERMPDATRNNLVEVEKLITDCVNSCMSLGLSIDDVRKAMNDMTFRMKVKENPELAEGRILSFRSVSEKKAAK